jgi:hypothetical protein
LTTVSKCIHAIATFPPPASRALVASGISRIQAPHVLSLSSIRRIAHGTLEPKKIRRSPEYRAGNDGLNDLSHKHSSNL